MIDKWQKLVDSRMHCPKVSPAEGWGILDRKCQGDLETTLLEETKQAQVLLGNERSQLRKLLLNTVNELQSILHQAQRFLPDSESLEAVRHPCLFKKKIIN